ncbi:MAG: MBL fold metallo-hydrolase [Lentisphaeria bacterium]|nr:MBL fold metallo-hydrolase [Lentisphaeria bacterium]
MKIQFIGTGAADWNWREYPAGTRGSTITLIDDALLIDAGPSLMRNLEMCNADPQKIASVLITHSHSDHFNPEQLMQLQEAAGHPIEIHAAWEALERLPNWQGTKTALTFGDEFRSAGFDVTATPANHLNNNRWEPAFHFVIKKDGTRVLYHLDGGWMLSFERDILSGQAAFGENEFDALILDAASGASYGDWRFADHNDLKMIDDMRSAMGALKFIDGKTLHVFDHIAWSLWPENADARNDVVTRHRGILAEDGEILSL